MRPKQLSLPPGQLRHLSSREARLLQLRCTLLQVAAALAHKVHRIGPFAKQRRHGALRCRHLGHWAAQAAVPVLTVRQDGRQLSKAGCQGSALCCLCVSCETLRCCFCRQPSSHQLAKQHRRPLLRRPAEQHRAALQQLPHLLRRQSHGRAEQVRCHRCCIVEHALLPHARQLAQVAEQRCWVGGTAEAQAALQPLRIHVWHGAGF